MQYVAEGDDTNEPNDTASDDPRVTFDRRSFERSKTERKRPQTDRTVRCLLLRAASCFTLEYTFSNTTVTNRFHLVPSRWCQQFLPRQPSVLCQWPSLVDAIDTHFTLQWTSSGSCSLHLHIIFLLIINNSDLDVSM